MSNRIDSKTIKIRNLKLHWLEAGTGPVILLLHGWPTSSYLWRNIMPGLAQNNRVIALDLPGFGESDKSLDATYNFAFYRQILDDFFSELGIDQLGMAVHDLGGPIGLDWAVHNPNRVTHLALLNTLVYPKPSWAVIAFVTAARIPLLRSLLVSRRGLRMTMRLGMQKKPQEEMLAAVVSPFKTKEAGKVLLKTAYELNISGLAKIANKLPTLKMPVRLFYAENDRILPDVAKTMQRVKGDLPQAELSSLPNCGHFLQEDEPEATTKVLVEFFQG